MVLVRDNLFHHYNIIIKPYNKAQVTMILSTFYKNNFHNKNVKTLTLYQDLDLVIL